MSIVRPPVPLFRLLLPVLLLLSLPSPAEAQSADDVAARVGTVARAMGAVAREPWSLNAALTTAINRGNTDTTDLRTTVVYVRDDGAWRFGSYLSGAIDRKDGVKANERAGLNLALARRFTEEFRLVLLEEVVHAPLDGLRIRNLFGGMAVWTPQAGDVLETSYYAGVGWAHERFTGIELDENYGAGLAGASATVTLSDTSTVNVVASYTQDLTETDNYKLGSTMALKAAINAVMGLQVSYGVAYDNAPAANRRRTNHSLTAGLTLGWKGD